jgi:CRISPR-associated endonuclease/helicase Cas3
MQRMFYAHSTGLKDRSDWQTLQDHLVAVAALAGERGGKFGAHRAAALAGILHDLGKYTVAFQRRLDGSGEPVDHSTPGAKSVGSLVLGGADRGIAELIAYAIAGHHAGLPDREGESGSLTERLAKAVEPLDPIWQKELSLDLNNLMPAFRWQPDRSRFAFQLGLLGRLIFSCLVDADFRDTEAFYARAEGRYVDRTWPALPSIIDRFVAAFDAYMAKKRKAAASTTVNRLREDVLAHARQKAKERPGIFTLTVPTGGGKTLVSLGFALDHAKCHSLDRIVYAIPFTSVIDQTATIFREVLGDDVVLEHHSAIDEERMRKREGAQKLRLAMEDWVAPIVVTTNVQLFESLFANRPSRCRKLHNLARSVIVLDEAQTVPLVVLRPCVAALDELARNYGASIVLCTATQPALAAPDFVGGFAADTVRELAPEPHQLATVLKRVEVRLGGEMTDEDLLTSLAELSQGLVIVNSRAHALALYRAALTKGLDGVVHLTTRQYAADRRKVLEQVRQRLAEGVSCRLIATSLVEAGVDLDFPRVWRAEAGLDQIAQAAGRCNREGRRPVAESIVTVFKPVEYRPPREIAQLSGDFARVASKHDDLLSLDTIRDYFGEVYWRKGTALDAKEVLGAFTVDGTGTDFAYRTVAENFRLIETGLLPVIIALDKAAKIVLAQLAAPDAHPGAAARRLQPYTVQVPPKARNLLLANGHVRFEQEKRFGDQFAMLVTGSLYKAGVGLVWENAEYLGLEETIV